MTKDFLTVKTKCTNPRPFPDLSNLRVLLMTMYSARPHHVEIENRDVTVIPYKPT